MSALVFGDLEFSFAIRCNVILGDPRKNCAGVGICYVEKLDGPPSHFIAGWEANFCFFGTQFLLMIIKDGIYSSALQSVLEAKAFTIETPFFLPEDIYTKRGKREALVIPKGFYPVLTLCEDVAVLFSLA